MFRGSYVVIKIRKQLNKKCILKIIYHITLRKKLSDLCL